MATWNDNAARDYETMAMKQPAAAALDIKQLSARLRAQIESDTDGAQTGPEVDAEAPVSANESAAEKRFYGRKTSKLPGKITYGEFSFALDCTIRDLTPTGALVAVSNPKKLPDNLILIEPSNLLAFEATIARRGANLIGLSFTGIILLDRELDDRDRILLMHAKMAITQWGRKSAPAK